MPAKLMVTVTASLLLLAMLSRLASAEIINVPDDYPTIQEAIEAAGEGDEVVVAEGEYFENINYNGKAITIRSADPEDPEVVANTIINGGATGSVVTCESGEGPDTVLSGFVITNGNSTRGGGMYNWQSSPTVSHCTFIGNSAEYDGGGMCNCAIDPHEASPTVTDCIFIENWAGHHGGGMCNWVEVPGENGFIAAGSRADDCVDGVRVRVSHPIVTGCTFRQNVAGSGGGMFSWWNNPTVTDCSFEGNTATYEGGGMGISCDWWGGVTTVTNCTFSGNTGSEGGAMSNDLSSPTVTNCTFTGNFATHGGGMFNSGGDPTVTDCTFTENSATVGGGMYSEYQSGPTVTNCILWCDVGAEIHDESGSSSALTYCDIQGGYEGEGNIDADPLFVDPESGDVHLQPGSPCIDAADNFAVPPDEYDLDEDGDTDEPVPVDLDGEPRFVNDPCTEDTGSGEPPIVDMGAYEFQPPCPCDLDCDGEVVTADLLYLLGAWGTPDGDVDGDGDTDTADLLSLLAAWGECP